MASDAEPLITHVTGVAEADTLRHVANRLTGALWQRERISSDADEQAVLQAERIAVRARLREVRAGTPDADQTLHTWVTRLRELGS